MVFGGAKIDVFQRFVPLGNFGTVLWGQGLESPLLRAPFTCFRRVCMGGGSVALQLLLA